MLNSLMQLQALRSVLAGIVGDRRGATAIEYGLIAAGIAIAIVAGINLVGGGISNLLNNVNSNL